MILKIFVYLCMCVCTMQVRVAFWERLNPDIVNSIRCKLYILACLPCVQLCITYKLFSNCSALKPCIPLVWQCDKWTMKTAWSQKERKLLTLCFSFLSPVYINYKYPQGTEEGMVLRWKVILTALNTKCRGISGSKYFKTGAWAFETLRLLLTPVPFNVLIE